MPLDADNTSRTYVVTLIVHTKNVKKNASSSCKLSLLEHASSDNIGHGQAQ